MPVILGHDPSLASYGLALVDTDELVLLASAVIETVNDGVARPRRLRILFDEIRRHSMRWQDKWAFDGAAFEAGFSFGNKDRGISADLAIAEARGVGYVTASHLEVTTLAPATVRLAVCGSGKAKKFEVAPAVERILKLRPPLQLDIADAAATALAAGGFAAPRISNTKPKTRRKAA